MGEAALALDPMGSQAPASWPRAVVLWAHGASQHFHGVGGQSTFGGYAPIVAEPADPATQGTQIEPNAETLDVILDWVKDVNERQVRDAEYLTTKLLQVFTAATVLIGFAGFSNTIPPGTPLAGRSHVVTDLVVLGLLVYLVAAGVAFFSIRTLKMRAARFGGTLWRDHWADDPAEVKVALLRAIREASDENERKLEPKGLAVQVVLILTSVEALFVTAAVLAARLGV